MVGRSPAVSRGTLSTPPVGRPAHGRLCPRPLDQLAPLCPDSPQKCAPLASSFLCLLRYELLQLRPQGNLDPVAAVRPVVHKDEVGVVTVQAGQVPLAFLIHDVFSRKATLGTAREAQIQTDGKCTGHVVEEEQIALGAQVLRAPPEGVRSGWSEPSSSSSGRASLAVWRYGRTLRGCWAGPRGTGGARGPRHWKREEGDHCSLSRKRS